MKKTHAIDLAGCCGLFCALCNKYQSRAPSRCLGCRSGEQHDWCSIYNCCVKKHGYVTCAECPDVFRCDIHIRRKVAEWIPAADNLRQIQKNGSEKFLKEQMKRQAVVEDLLQNYNEGRSMSFYCKACSRLSVEAIREVIKEAKSRVESENIEASDIKLKAKIVRAVMKEMAQESGVSLD